MSNGFFFLTVFFFIFAAWVAGGGPSRPISFAGPFLSPIIATGVNVPSSGSWGTETISSVQSGLSQTTQQLSDLQKQTNKEIAFGTPSPYRGQVTLSNGNAGATDPKQQYIYIRNSSSKTITISGWQVKSAATDRTATIPHGDPLPTGAGARASSPITLAPGQQAVVSTGPSPLNASFRENICSGYLTRGRSFVPQASLQCPYPREEYDRYYTGDRFKDTGCLTAIQNVSTCQTPSQATGLSAACYALIDQHLTYSGCVATHRYDPNFGGGSLWRVYLNYHYPFSKKRDSNDLLWKSKQEAIKLLDAEGKTVDLITY